MLVDLLGKEVVEVKQMGRETERTARRWSADILNGDDIGDEILARLLNYSLGRRKPSPTQEDSKCRAHRSRRSTKVGHTCSVTSMAEQRRAALVGR